MTNEDLFGLKDKIVIVTGAGKGIGFETALAFCRLGAHVHAISRTEEDLQSLETAATGLPGTLNTFTGDVSDSETVMRFTANVVSMSGRVDVLINNAGMRFRKPFLDISYDEWQQVLNVNAGSTFLFCQAVGPHMIAQKSGAIVNMASIIGTLSLPELSGYAASKGAIISLTKSLALEWAEHQIRVNVIAPGFCETSYADKFQQNKTLYNFTLERTPQGIWGQSEDIAKACIYLASDMSKYVTGETLSVDGGWSAW